jgi:hypothetical protein
MGEREESCDIVLYLMWCVYLKFFLSVPMVLVYLLGAEVLMLKVLPKVLLYLLGAEASMVIGLPMGLSYFLVVVDGTLEVFREHLKPVRDMFEADLKYGLKEVAVEHSGLPPN